jgi:hypothetical protein
MNATQIEEFTSSISNFDEKRPYIGLSNIGLDLEILVNNYLNGQEADHAARLKCYKGYQMEKDLVDRLKKMYGARISYKHITEFDNMLQGHPDFWFDNMPGDSKSVLLDKHLPEDKLSRKIYWQMQGYMLYSNTNKAVVVYESRESGKIRVKWVNRNEVICREIKTKVEAILKILSSTEMA